MCVLNAYSLQTLQHASGTRDMPYAIVSLLITQGEHFQDLKKLSAENKECIVAITGKTKGSQRRQLEQGLKYAVMKKLHWNNVKCALDDKPHEWQWFGTETVRQLKLDASKKPVYLITYAPTK